MASYVSPQLNSNPLYDFYRQQAEAEEAAVTEYEKEIGMVPEKSFLERSADRERNAKIGTASNVLMAGPKRNGDINVRDVRNSALRIILTTWNPTTRKHIVVEAVDKGKDMQSVRNGTVERRGIVENAKISPRMYAPQIRTRVSSSTAESDGANKRRVSFSIAESDGANKRQKVMTCDFYAKGLCLKGASCRFAHVKACQFYAKGLCLKGASCRFAHVKACEFYAKGRCMKGESCRFTHVKEGSDAAVKKSESKSGVACHRKGSSSGHGSSVSSFEAAIIDHVKELMIPAWQKGFMSKGMYKLIVKKSVDKVLSSVQYEVPMTRYQIKSYITRSQEKLAKLVEGYVIKYGKP